MTNDKKEIQRLKKLLEQQGKIIHKQEKHISELKQSYDALIQQLRRARKDKFGRSSELTPDEAKQMSIFNTDEELSEHIEKKEQKITVKQHSRKKKKVGFREEMLGSIEKEVVEYEIEDDAKCPVCKSDLKKIGKEYVRTQVDFIPAKLIVKRYIRNVYKCLKCGTDLSDKPTDTLVKASVPTPLLNHSIATASLVSQVMYLKYYMGSPLYRQEQYWSNIGLMLPRANMASWVNKISERWLLPVYERIHKSLLECETLHMDETRIQCNKEPGKKASSTSFMWVMCSGEYEKTQAVIFNYDSSRRKEVATNMLENYKGILITDAYGAYQNIEDINSAFCWAHVRRYYKISIPLDGKGKEIPGSKGNEARKQINKLFKIESKIKDISADEKLKQRQEKSKPILEAFWSWVEETGEMHTTNEDLTKALNYSKNHRDKLDKFLEDGRIPLSNNRCEAAIRPFATHRRAWLFADTVKGANANAIIYSIVGTAILNNLNIFEYLKYLLSQMPDLCFNDYPELLDNLLPWSKKLPDKCFMTKDEN